MMLIDGLGEVYMIDRDNTVFHVPALSFWKRKQLHQPIEKTLVDGEMVIDKVDDKPVPRYLIYDIIKFEVATLWQYSHVLVVRNLKEFNMKFATSVSDLLTLRRVRKWESATSCGG